MYTFKCTGTCKSSSICMTGRDNNDELEEAFVKQPFDLHPIKFQNVCLCMSMYMRAVHKSFQSNFTFSMKGHTDELAQSQFQPYCKLHSRFLRFRKFRFVISNTRGVMSYSLTPCLDFLGR